jgi:hypothetical protein
MAGFAERFAVLYKNLAFTERKDSHAKKTVVALGTKNTQDKDPAGLESVDGK